MADHNPDYENFPLLIREETRMEGVSEQNPAETPPRRRTWRQVLNEELVKIINNRSGIHDISDKDWNHNKKLVTHAIRSFISLVVPLTITFLLLLIIMYNLPFFRDKTYIFAYYTPIEEKATDSTSTKFGHALVNSLIFASIVIVQTVILFLLYKYKFYRVIYGFLYVSILLTVGVLSYSILVEVLAYWNIPMDWITSYFLIVNYSVVGMAVIFTSLSPFWQRVFHINSSAIIGCFFIRVFPEWTGWVVLGVLVIWDLVAVLTPYGPLRLLVETANSRQEALFPALIFKTMLEPDLNTAHSFNTESEFEIELNNSTPNSNQAILLDTEFPLQNGTETQQNATDNAEDEFEGSQLGLGDFIFFGILIGKASLMGDINDVFITYIAIIFGFLVTYLILICLGQALPALPVSLVIGLIFTFISKFFLSPYLIFISSHKLII